jgi:hypothetical protein
MAPQPAMAQYRAEKVYIHFDRNVYVAGENCWFKAYVVNAEDLRPTETSGVLYVDFIDPAGRIVSHQKLKIYDGETNSNLAFSNDLQEGYYSVRSYTNAMRNAGEDFFFSTSLYVFNASGKRTDSTKIMGGGKDVQFFAEGGEAVNNLQVQLAFKAVGENGRGIDVHGEILDEKNVSVATVESVHRGMGVFPYIPSKEKKYRLVLNSGESFDLPKGMESGVVMNINNMNPAKIIVQIQCSEDLQNKDLTLTGRSNETVRFTKFINTRKGLAKIEIPKSELPEGILELRLNDSRGIPKSERIVFIDKEENFRIGIETDKHDFLRRDSIPIKIHVSDRNGNPVETALSISITDNDIVNTDSLSNNIYTQLLLQSDLKGLIEEPAWYFQNNSSTNKYALDLVMMTSGWRKIVPANVVQKYTPERYLTLAGRVEQKDKNKIIPSTRLTLLVAGEEYNGFYTTDCDEKGRFRLDSVDFSDSTMLIWQVVNEKGKRVEADIILDSRNDTLAVSVPRYTTVVKRKTVTSKMAQAHPELTDSAYARAQLLKEVEVVRRRRSGNFGINRRMIRPTKDDYKKTTMQYLSQYAMGLPHLVPRELPDGGTMWVTTANRGVTLVIDGYVVFGEYGPMGTPIGGGPDSHPYIAFNSIRTDQIEYAIVNGSNHDGYYIIIKTRHDMPPELHRGIVRTPASGYTWTREFYHPKYGPENISSPEPDNRITLFWDPYVVTDTNGNAVIYFYNSDSAKKFTIVAEGMANGLMGSSITKFGNSN